MKLPEFPRRIRSYLKQDRGLEKLKPKRPVNVSKTTKYRVSVRNGSAGSMLVYPEIFIDKWYPLVSDQVLVTRVPAMIGHLSRIKVNRLRVDWNKWLEDWRKANNLKAVPDTSPRKAVKKIKKASKKAGARQYPPDEEFVKLVNEVGKVRAAKLLGVSYQSVGERYKQVSGQPVSTEDHSSSEDLLLQPLLPDS
jgi:hypothetical protein